jgi:hypothetical protein
MHRTIDELCEEGRVAVAVHGPSLVSDYGGFPRTLETFVSHAGGECCVLLEVSALETDQPGQPWRHFEFTSTVLEEVETCAVVAPAADHEFVQKVAELLLPEAIVRLFDADQRDAAVAWLSA